MRRAQAIAHALKRNRLRKRPLTLSCLRRPRSPPWPTFCVGKASQFQMRVIYTNHYSRGYDALTYCRTPSFKLSRGLQAQDNRDDLQAVRQTGDRQGGGNVDPANHLGPGSPPTALDRADPNHRDNLQSCADWAEIAARFSTADTDISNDLEALLLLHERCVRLAQSGFQCGPSSSNHDAKKNISDDTNISDNRQYI